MSAVDLAVVLGEVVLVDLDQLVLDLADLGRVLVLQPGVHALRHAADDKVVVQTLQQTPVEDILNGLFLLDRGIVGEQGRVCGLQELIEGQRSHVQ